MSLKKSEFKDVKDILNDDDDAKQNHPYQKTVSTLLSILIIGALMLFTWEVNIYQHTFIPFKIPFAIWILTGLAVTPFLRKIHAIYFIELVL